MLYSLSSMPGSNSCSFALKALAFSASANPSNLSQISYLVDLPLSTILIPVTSSGNWKFSPMRANVSLVHISLISELPYCRLNDMSEPSLLIGSSQAGKMPSSKIPIASIA